jgi:hypothetical protein
MSIFLNISKHFKEYMFLNSFSIVNLLNFINKKTEIIKLYEKKVAFFKKENKTLLDNLTELKGNIT